MAPSRRRHLVTLQMPISGSCCRIERHTEGRAMFRTATIVVCSGIFLGQFFFQQTAMARQHTQNVSSSLAHDICSNGGQSWNDGCSFCHGQHCHLVSCDSHNKCTNIVYTNIKGVGGKHRTPITQVNGGSNGTTHTPVKHPVHIGSGLKPIVGTGSNGGYKGGGPDQNGYKGGGPNQGGGHHR